MSSYTPSMTLYTEYAWSILPWLNLREDLHSALVLNETLLSMPNSTCTHALLSKLSLQYRDAVVMMPGPNLLDEVKLCGIRALLEESLIVVVDSAVVASHKLNLVPDLIVTDLDGDVELIRRYNVDHEVHVIVHAHGDNVDKIVRHVRCLRGGSVSGTCQYPVDLERVSFCPGFTDGDRTLYMLSRASFRTIYVLGLDYSRPTQVKRDVRSKMLKLRVAEDLTRLAQAFESSRILTASSLI